MTPGGGPVAVADLRPVDLFDDLDDAALAEWAAVACMQEAEPGEIIVEQGDSPRGLQCLISGAARTKVHDGDRLEDLGRQTAPTWIGAIAVLTEGPLGVRMQAETACRIALIPGEDFRRLALAHPPVHRRIMRQVGPVMSRITGIEQSRERLTALGTMAAGLAHELNNPAAAAKRSAAELADALDVVGATLGAFVRAGISRDDAERLVELQEAALRGAEGRTALDALDAADVEDEMRDRLEALGVADAWKLAEPLAVAGVGPDWVEEMTRLAGSALPAALGSVAASLTARSLVAELRASTGQMSDLVGAVKTFAYMDRGGVVEADVHEGLETTVAVLGHKLRHASIEISRDYDRTLPPLTMHGSELNQVWTNLIDNAIDAVGESGTITLSTRRDADCAVVDVGDDGPGIPEEVRGRVLDPFFTTKEVGHGTGLGLDTARRIVTDRHDGSLTFDTGPEGTTFHVRLPLTTSVASAGGED